MGVWCGTVSRKPIERSHGREGRLINVPILHGRYVCRIKIFTQGRCFLLTGALGWVSPELCAYAQLGTKALSLEASGTEDYVKVGFGFYESAGYGFSVGQINSSKISQLPEQLKNPDIQTEVIWLWLKSGVLTQ